MSLEIFEEQFKIRYYQVNASNHITLGSLFRLLQEAGGEHHTAVSDSLIKLYNQGYGWILLQAAIQFIRPPQYGETITVRTWISDIGTIKAQREYQVLDQNGQTLVKAQKLWAFIDIKKKRPIALPDDIRNKWTVIPEKLMDNALTKFTVPQELPITETICTRKSDLDLNAHVNNIHFIEWLQETLPINEKNIKSLNAKFLAEAKYPEKLLISATSADQNPAYCKISSIDKDRTCFVAQLYFET